MKLNPGDIHVITNGQERTCQGYDSTGKKIFQFESRCEGQNGNLAYGGDPKWDVTGGDTVPGEYEYTHYEALYEPGYGLLYFYMTSLDGKEQSYGRDGIGHHGGSSADTDPYMPHQPLHVTMGCQRSYNADLASILLPAYLNCKKARGRMYLTVQQPGPLSDRAKSL